MDPVIMKRAEKALWAVFVAGVALKFMHLPGGGILVVLSASGLGMLYWLGVVWFGDPTRRDQRVVLSIMAGIAFSIATLGLLFKIQHWPFSAFYLLVGAISCAATAAMAAWAQRTDVTLVAYCRGLVRRGAFLAFLAGVLYLLPVRTLLTWQYPKDPLRVELLDSLSRPDLSDADRVRLHEQLFKMDEEVARTSGGHQ